MAARKSTKRGPTARKQRRSSKRRKAPRRKRAKATRLHPGSEKLRRMLGVVALAALPFLLLVRGSVAAWAWFSAPGWVAIVIGTSSCAVILTLLGARVWHRMTGRNRRREIALWLVIPAVTAFSIYSIGWLAHANAKNHDVSTRWEELHPALRLALGTARLAEPNFVVTGIGRSPADYDRMGLPRAHRSPHYPQADGWVHAIDLRTQGRSELRNRLLQGYFALMGFKTLRHHGNADHLHVSLPKR